MTSTSTVGLPRLSRIWRAVTDWMTDMESGIREGEKGGALKLRQRHGLPQRVWADTAPETIDLVRQAAYRGGNAAAAPGERRARELAHGHHGGAAEEPAVLGNLADAFAVDGDDAHRRRFVVDHPDGELVEQDARNGFGRRVAGDRHHVEPDGAD